MDTYTNYERIRILPCLSLLDNEELKDLVLHSEILNFRKNQLIFHQGDNVKHIFIVVSGSIKLYKQSFEGREKIIKMMREGDYFCFAPLLNNKKTHIVNAEAIEDSEVLVIDADLFSNLIFGELNEGTKKIIASLCNRVFYLSKMVEALTFKDVEQRIVLFLKQTADEKAPDEDIVQLSLTHRDIASMVGTVREVVSRTMSKLKKRGVIVHSTVKGFKIDRSKLDSLIF